MRILVCGKGGAGKSTVTALLSRTLAANGRRVAVLDTDTSNVSLHRLLGTDAPPDLTRFFAGAPGLRRILEEARRKGIPPGEPLLGRWTFDTLPEGYACARDGVALPRAGKIADATQYGKGRWVAIARQFLAGLEGRVLPADHPAVAALAGELERLRAR